MTFSIIVPVYNVEKYLSRCLDSLLNQTCKDFEVILVNDGSTDRSGEIIAQYKDKFSDIKVVDQTNQGLSAARNSGIRVAEGEYLIFLDSDDDIEPETCEKLLHVLNRQGDAEVIACGFKRIKNDETVISNHTTNLESVISGYQFLYDELRNNSLYMAAWSYIYRRKFLEEQSLRFKNGILHEDEEFTPRVLLKAEKVLTLEYAFYNYYINPGTITTKKNKKKNAEDLLDTIKQLEKQYEQLPDVELKKYLMNSLLEKYLYMFMEAGVIDNRYYDYIDKNLVKGKAIGMKNKIKAGLFLVSPRLYAYIYKRVLER